MPGHTGGSTSRLCSDRYRIQKQLSTGKTLRGVDLSDETIAALEVELASVEEEMEELAAQRAKEKEEQKAIQRHLIIDGIAAKVDASTTAVNSHTTSTVTASENVITGLFNRTRLDC